MLVFIVFWQFSFKISNAAITILLRFLKYFMVCVGKAFQTNSVQDMGHAIPPKFTILTKVVLSLL
jgi:hypothetical protein